VAFLASFMFVYSLTILFNQIDLLSPLEALFVLAGLFVIVWILAPAPEAGFRPWSSEHYFFSCWAGGQGLIAVFWPFFLILNAALASVDWLVKSGWLTVSSWDDLHFMLLLPIIWWTVSIWRCSAHADLRLYGGGARFVTICVFLEFALKLYIRIDYPRLFFNCEELLLDYGSCF